MLRSLIGAVASTKQNKTVIVSVTRHVTHPVYRKRYLVTKKFFARDENRSSKEGDLVEISETRPRSKHTMWSLTRIVKSAPDQHKVKKVAK